MLAKMDEKLIGFSAAIPKIMGLQYDKCVMIKLVTELVSFKKILLLFCHFLKILTPILVPSGDHRHQEQSFRKDRICVQQSKQFEQKSQKFVECGQKIQEKHPQ